LNCQGSTLQVAAADQFLLDRLRRQFAADLQALASEIGGETGSVRFEVDTALKACPSAEPSSGTPSLAYATSTTPAVPVRSTKPKRRVPLADFHSFVVGDGNRVAFTAAQSVLQRPGSISPFFVHGPTGCGKTHLLEALQTGFRGRCRFGRALKLSAEQFTSSFLEALQGSGLPSFRRKVRDVDFLAVDDLQFFAGKRATLVELQHTIDALLRQGRQLVLAADRPPAELKGLGPELIGRVAGGLVCGIEPADFQTRLAIADRIAQGHHQTVPPAVLELLAAELDGDARQIAGALNRLQATGEALEKPITLDLAAVALEDIFRATRRPVHLVDIEKAVCDVFGLEAKSLRDGRKAKSISQPRMLAMWLARKHTRAAFSEISHYFGRRSHSTVISAEKKVNGWVKNEATIQLGLGACRVEEAIRRVETQLRTG
jgi:chromosomal replication initiator protein